MSLGCVSPVWFTFENPFGKKERETESSLTWSRAPECCLCRGLLRLGLGGGGRVGGCRTSWAGGCQSSLEPSVAELILHTGAKGDRSLALPVGSQPGLGRISAQTGGRAALPRKHSPGICELTFPLGLTLISLLVDRDFKTHCCGIPYNFENKIDESLCDRFIADRTLGLASPPCSA